MINMASRSGENIPATAINVGDQPDVTSFATKVLQVQQLEARLAEAEAALTREHDRAELLAAEVQRLRLSAAASHSHSRSNSPLPPDDAAAAGGAGSGDGGDELVLAVRRRTLELLALKERAMDTVKEGITIADATAPDMPLIYVNEAFSRITGYPTTYARGKNCRFLQGKGTDPKTVRQLREAMETGQPCVVQLMNYRRSGDPFINYLSLTPVHDSAGYLTHYVGVQADITEMVQQRQAELSAKHAAVQAASATEAKSQFLARMSHEIRTPLNGMIAVGQLLAETALTPAQWDLVNTIRCSGEALLTLITDILDFSRIEANKMVLSRTAFRLKNTIEAAIEIAGMHAAQKRLQVAYHVAPEVPRCLMGDAQRLQQVLLNILNNALKFTEEGEVLLEVWAQRAQQHQGGGGGDGEDRSESGDGAAASPPSLEQAAAAAAGGDEWEVHFSVRDTGIGISGEDLSLLFQSFSQVDASPTRRFGGSGLGLAISQKLAEAMGGRMWAQSAGAGLGSTFRWCIRAEAAPESAAPSAPPFVVVSPLAAGRPAPRLLPGKRVLLVESCDMVREVVALALRRWGCAVCEVPSEAEALRALRLKDPTAAAAAQCRTGHSTHSERGCPPRRLQLGLSGGAAAEAEPCSGPYDVVVMDVAHSGLLHALMEHSREEEACRVVFTGWPGHNELESEDGSGSDRTVSTFSAPSLLPAYRGGGGDLTDVRETAVVARPPRALTDVRQPSGRRQLGYVVVTRPVRQERLRLALEEVLAMSMAPSRPGSVQADTCSTAMAATINSEDGSEDGRAASLASSGGGGSSSLRHAPFNRVNSSGNIPQAAAAARDNSSQRLLLAEDNAINMKVALGILRRLGFTNVVTAGDGEAAVAAVAAAGGPDAFDAILMDLHMPKKGGIEAVQDIRRRWPKHRTKVIAVTADAFEDTRDNCIANGFTGWLAKPFRVEEFARCMGLEM